MTPEQKQRLAEIKERESKATAGPWQLHFYNVPGNPVYAIEDGDGDGGELAQFWGGTDPEEWPAKVNAEFCAHSRTDIPFLLTLLDQADRVEADLSRIKARNLVNAIKQICGKCGHTETEDGCIHCFKVWIETEILETEVGMIDARDGGRWDQYHRLEGRKDALLTVKEKAKQALDQLKIQ